MLTKPKIFSFFAGSGFLDLGFETGGFDIVYVNEICQSFLQAYQYSRQNLKISEPIYGYHQTDVNYLIEGEAALHLNYLVKDARQSNNIVGFIGGPPCPDFSVGGRNKGSKGDNGKLSSSYIELICQQKPDFFLFENVKGLYKTKKHRIFFEKLKEKLCQSGYTLAEKLINTLEYKVPQNRDRIILIGFHNSLLKDLDIYTNQINNLIPEEEFPWGKNVFFSKQEILSLPWVKINNFKENSQVPCPDNLIKELTVEYWFRKNDVYHHFNTNNHFKPRAGIKRFASVEEGDDSRKSYKRLHRWRYSPTACYGNNEVHLHPYKIRRISVAEALAIQSMPKEFILPKDMSLTNMFKTIGNGVPYLAAKGLAKTILDFLDTSYYYNKSGEQEQLELPLFF